MLDVLRNVKLVIDGTLLYVCYKWTTEMTELHQFRKNLAMMVIYLPVKLEFDWTKRSESGNKNVDRQMDVGHINLIGGLVTHNLPNEGFQP